MFMVKFMYVHVDVHENVSVQVPCTCLGSCHVHVDVHENVSVQVPCTCLGSCHVHVDVHVHEDVHKNLRVHVF